jgi:hypothetical protein
VALTPDAAAAARRDASTDFAHQRGEGGRREPFLRLAQAGEVMPLQDRLGGPNAHEIIHDLPPRYVDDTRALAPVLVR